jgi:hypothetical protein
MDGLDIPSPEMKAPEIAFLHTLISDGFYVNRVDQGPWDNLVSQASADLVNTSFGDLIVVAPHESDHPLWVCVKSVNDAHVPTYDLAVGGDHGMVQLAGSVSFGRVGDVLVVSQDATLWRRLMPLVSSVGCPAQ